MKKTVRVVITKEIEVDIPDYQLTPEHIKMFEEGIFELDGDEHNSKVASYFEYAASMAAREYPSSDGLGEIGSEFMRQYTKDKDYYVTVDTTYDDIEAEVLE